MNTKFKSDEAGYDRHLVLDGQQRLTSLLIAARGSYDAKRLHLNVLSGKVGDKGPGDTNYEGEFLSAKEASTANSNSESPPRHHFVPFSDLVNIHPRNAPLLALRKGQQLGLPEADIEQLTDLYVRAASVMGDSKALQVIFIGESPGDEPSIDEVLEIFVRVNSGGLVLQKADLLMSLLDLHWNDIQPELMKPCAISTRVGRTSSHETIFSKPYSWCWGRKHASIVSSQIEIVLLSWQGKWLQCFQDYVMPGSSWPLS